MPPYGGKMGPEGAPAEPEPDFSCHRPAVGQSLVRPLGLCPMAGLWRLFLVWPGVALTRPYAVWASASRQALLSTAPASLPRSGRVAANSVWPLGPVRPCLVKPLGLCPTAGLWQLKSGSGSAGAPSGPILPPYGGMVSFYLQPGPREQQSLSCTGLG